MFTNYADFIEHITDDTDTISIPEAIGFYQTMLSNDVDNKSNFADFYREWFVEAIDLLDILRKHWLGL